MRDIRIDLLRGYAMLTIALNHLSFLFADLGLRRRPFPTLTSYSYSSAAEVFFLLSGYMVGLVYLGRPNLRRKLWSRAGKIYVYNGLAFVAAMVVVSIFGSPLSTATDSDPFLINPVVATIRFLLLLQHPDLLGVLALYVIFMIATPLLVYCAHRAFWPVLAVLLTLYVMSQALPWFNLPGGTPTGDYQWNFNPAAWQLLFFGGVFAGRSRYHTMLFQFLEKSRPLCWTVLIALGLSIALRQSMLHGQIIPSLYDKENLGPLRLAHALLVVTALCALMVVMQSYLANPVSRILALCGRQTLNCYTASIPLTFLLGGIWVTTGRSYIGYLAACAVIAGSVIIVAWMTEWRRRSDRRAAPVVGHQELNRTDTGSPDLQDTSLLPTER